MKKMLKFLFTIAIILCFFAGTSCFATKNTFSLGGDDGVPPIMPAGADTTAGEIIGAMRWVGYAIAVGMLVYIGIKYVMASANEKADLKQSLVKYLIGAIIIVFATTIASFVFSL